MSRSDSEDLPQLDPEPQLRLKETEIKEEDWRGILALVFTLGTITIGTLELFITGTSSLFDKLLSLNGLIIAFYFGSKTR